MWRAQRGSVTSTVQTVSATHCALKAASLQRCLVQAEWAEHTFQGQRRGEETPIAHVHLMGQPEVISSPWPPPTLRHLQSSHVLVLSVGKLFHFQVRKWRSTNRKWLAQGHRAGKWLHLTNLLPYVRWRGYEKENKGKYSLSPWSLPSNVGERHSINNQTKKVNHNCSKHYKEKLRKGVYNGESCGGSSGVQLWASDP